MQLFRQIPVFACLVLVANMAMGQSLDQVKPLRVKISNITTLQGQVMLAVYDKQEDFLTEKVVTSAMAPVKANEVFMQLDSLALQRPYVISIYHDVNGNGKLDTNFMSIPTEPYGFSNNNLGLMAIPNYQKSSFLFDEQLDSLEIILR
ncbi:MAG: DUF2141 domain-containing protein [Bacteroidota bacterium]